MHNSARNKRSKPRRTSARYRIFKPDNKTISFANLPTNDADLQLWVTLAEVGIILTRGEPLQRSLDKGLSACSIALSADVLSIMVLNEKGNTLIPLGAVGIEAEQLKPIKCSDNLQKWTQSGENELFAHNPRMFACKPKAKSFNKNLSICIPLTFRDQILGFMVVARHEGNEPIVPAECDFARAVATLFTVAIRSDIPREDIMDRERIERSLQYAHTLQHCFMPESIANIPGFRVAVRHSPSLEMAGDFFDVIKLAGDWTCLAIGETSGRGVEAGLNIARTVSELRGILAAGLGAAETLLAFNKRLIGQKQSNFLVNMALIFLNTSEGYFTFSAAGSTRVYLLAPNDNSLALLKSSSATPLGIISAWNYTETKHNIVPGGVFFAHTDGLVNCVNKEGEIFNRSSLESCIVQSLQVEEQAADLVLEALQKHLKEMPTMDDVTLLSVEREC